MTRIVVIFSFFFAAACDVGSIQQAGTGIDGGVGSGSGSGSNGVVCETVSANIPDGHHNPGMSCIVGGCHGAPVGTGAPLYSYAGTVYKDVAGTTPYPGATIFAKLGATEVKTIAANNGNFWIVPGVGGLDAPTNAMTATTKASACPNSPPMAGALVQAGGNCNNCHRTGGTTTPVYVLP